MKDRFNTTDYDQSGQSLRRVCVDHHATKLWFLTEAQRQELAAGREVIIITPRGERTDIALVQPNPLRHQFSCLPSQPLCNTGTTGACTMPFLQVVSAAFTSSLSALQDTVS